MRTLKQKQEDAAWRQTNYNKLTTQEKFARLPPTGSERERKKLLKQLEIESIKVKVAETQKVVTKRLEAAAAAPLKAKERRAKDKNRGA